jgi:glucoamylase
VNAPGAERASAADAAFEAWLERQYGRSAQLLLRAVSAVGLCKTRFGRRVCAARGSIVASPILGAYDPDPDYFFHWFRDAAVVMDALRRLHEDGIGPEAQARFAEFLHFELALRGLDGGALEPDWRQGIEPHLAQFARDDAELARVHGAAVTAETRINPDGTLDLLRWPRPQHDGPALRALTLLRWRRSPLLEPAVRADLEQLLRLDLEFVRTHWSLSSFDMWEEELGQHYYVLCVSAAALDAGAEWLAECGEPGAAESDRTEARNIRHRLDDYWLPEAGHYRSRVLPGGGRSAKELDMAVVFGVVHAGPAPSQDALRRHGAGDPRVLATLAQLEALFERSYAINQGRPASTAPAMGRYTGDVYYSGGAYYFSTLAAAELCFEVAACADRTTDAGDWLTHGDAFLRTVQRFTPDDGALSEQFDQNTGEQSSARQLTWSHAALISAVAARRRARARLENS